MCLKEIPIEYDIYGRMKYNPEFHENMGKNWDQEEVSYLVLWYDIIGPEEMSFALSRTIKSVMQKVLLKRRDGSMVKPVQPTHTKRIKKDPLMKGL